MNIEHKVRKINEAFANGEIPEGFDFWTPIDSSNQLLDDVIDKMKHLAFHKDFQFYADRFPYYQSIQGFDKVIQQMADKNKDKSLSEALQEHNNISNDNIEDNGPSISNSSNE